MKFTRQGTPKAASTKQTNASSNRIPDTLKRDRRDQAGDHTLHDRFPKYLWCFSDVSPKGI
jgi:hypothetical protein